MLPPSFDELESKQSYRKLYRDFVSRIQDNATDIRIKEFLGEQKSIKSEEMFT